MKLTCLAVSVSALLASVSPVLAQGQAPARPFRGLFGAAALDPAANQGLDFTATLVEAYDDNLLAESGSIAVDSPRVSGHYTMVQALGQYRWRNDVIELGVTGASAFRYYDPDGRVRTLSHTGGIGLAATLARRTKLALNQGIAYSPSYLVGLFPRVTESQPGEAPRAAPDYEVSDLASRSYVTTASLAHGLSKRVSLTADADFTFADFTRETHDRRDVSAQGARLGVSRNLGRHTAIGSRYLYRTGAFAGMGANSATEHGVEVGLDHARVLSATRRAHLAFRIGISTMDVPRDATRTSRGHFYRIRGEASVSYPFGRSWHAGAAYRRGLEYVSELTEPVIVDGFSGTVGGLLTRRLDFVAAAGYSSGESALYAASAFDTYTGTVRSRFALTGSLALYGEYLFYFYDFGANALLVEGLPRRLSRLGVRGGLTVWMPVLRR